MMLLLEIVGNVVKENVDSHPDDDEEAGLKEDLIRMSLDDRVFLHLSFSLSVLTIPTIICRTEAH